MIQWFKNILRSTLSNPSQWMIDWIAGGEPSASGIKVNAEKALTYAAVWRAINKISRDVAKLPLFVYTRTDDGRDVVGGHPAMKLLRRRPSEYMTAFTFKQVLTSHALLQGSGYAAINRKGGVPTSLTLLLPEHTEPILEGAKLYYKTRIHNNGRATEYIIPSDDMIHIRGLSHDGITPYSVIKLAKETLGIGLAARKYGAKFFANNGKPSLLLKHPGRIGDDGIKALRKSWGENYAGLDNAHKVAILEEGMDAVVMGMNHEDAQFLETRQFEIREIAAWFGLPPHFLGDTTRQGYASLEQENQSYLDDTLDGWLCTWEHEVHSKLFTEQEKRSGKLTVEFKRQAIVRADLETRYAAYAVAINNRFMNPNEVRALENLNASEGGNEFLVPLNVGQGGADNQAKLDPIKQGGDDDNANPAPVGANSPAK